MLITSVLLFTALLAGLYLTLRELFNAPEAYENENGFQAIWVNVSPTVRNVSCVWLADGDLPSVAI